MAHSTCGLFFYACSAASVGVITLTLKPDGDQALAVRLWSDSDADPARLVMVFRRQVSIRSGAAGPTERPAAAFPGRYLELRLLVESFMSDEIAVRILFESISIVGSDLVK